MPATLIVLFALSACAPSRFVRTDASHTEARAPRPPAVFIGEAPERPWRAVGRIEVTLGGKATHEEALALAIEAGQQAGCDLLSQGAPSPQQSQVNTLTIHLVVLRNGHEDHAPQPLPTREVPDSKDSSSASSTSSQSSSSSASAGADAPVSGGGSSGRARRWKFDCGVYSPAGASATST